MSFQEKQQDDIQALSKKVEELEYRIQRIEQQQQEQRLEPVQHQAVSFPRVVQQKQHQGALCSVQGCNLPAVTTCEHGLSGFSKPCGRKICVNHVTKREGGWGYDRGIREYCPLHA